MTNEIQVIPAAIAEVSEEQSEVRAEIVRLKGFREAVRLTQPRSGGGSESTQWKDELLQRFREMVETEPDAGISSDASEESLQEQLIPEISDVLDTSGDYTQRLKRKILVQTSDSIAQRERFLDALDLEREFLRTALENLEQIQFTAQTLPECTIHRHSLDEFLDIWEEYEELVQRCEDLLAQRQQMMNDPRRNVHSSAEPHDLNRYLYWNLKTPYPVLSAIAAVRTQIERTRDDAEEIGRFEPVLNNRCR